MASTAEALYTITTLVHTSSKVAVNRNLSDLSFRAILRVFVCPAQPDDTLKVPGTSAETTGVCAAGTGRRA